MTKWSLTRFFQRSKVPLTSGWDFKGKISKLFPFKFTIKGFNNITVLINVDCLICFTNVCDTLYDITDIAVELIYRCDIGQGCQITNSDVSFYDDHVMVVLCEYVLQKAIYCVMCMKEFLWRWEKLRKLQMAKFWK